MTDKYILNEKGEPVPEPNLLKWAEWFENSRTQRVVAQNILPNGYYVSTVFLALDYSWGGKYPVLWESMVFRPEGGSECEIERYKSRKQAEIGHKLLVKKWGKMPKI